jgi:hypothetical protein
MRGTFFHRKKKKSTKLLAILKKKKIEKYENFLKKFYHFLYQKNKNNFLEKTENIEKIIAFKKLRDKNVKVLKNKSISRRGGEEKYLEIISLKQKKFFYQFFRPFGRMKSYKKKALSLKLFRNFLTGNNWTFLFSKIIKFKIQKIFF